MKIVFVGGLFPPDRREEIIKTSKGIVQFGVDIFQWAFIKGLDSYIDNLSIYTSPSIGNYPFNYRKPFFNKSEFSHNSKSKDYCMGFITIPGINLFSKTYSIYKSLVKNERSSNIYIIVSCVHTPYLLAAVLFKNKFPNSKICLVVPDHPQYMADKIGNIYKFLKNIELRFIHKLIRSVDTFVFITDQMATQFKIGNKPWVRIEGIYNSDNIIQEATNSNPEQKIVFYSGLINSRYGIKILLDAFKLIPYNNYRLWICGEGNMKDQLIEYAKLDKRVTFYGQVTHEEVLKLQKESTVLVNPRTSEGEYTKYSFPGKTMEYIASGKPCIMNLLPGMPFEYIEHVFIPDEENAASLSNKIMEVCTMNPVVLKEKCSKAKAFILEKKNAKSQVYKVFKMINSVKQE